MMLLLIVEFREIGSERFVLLLQASNEITFTAEL